MVFTILSFVAGLFGRSCKEVFFVGFSLSAVVSISYFNSLSSYQRKILYGEAPHWLILFGIAVDCALIASAFFVGQYIYKRRKKVT